MFYVIRVIFIAILVLPIIYILRKGKQLQKQRAEQGYNTEIVVKKRHYVYCIIFFLVLFGIMNGSFYPFEKHFLTFSSEEAAFSYICKDSSDYERFEKGNAIFYVDRDERTDTLYTITKIGDRYSYVDYEAKFAEYRDVRYDDIDLYDGTTPPDIKRITHSSEVDFNVIAAYNKKSNITFYNVVARKLENPEDHTATLNDKPLTYATDTNKRWFTTETKANCYYYFDEAEPIEKIAIKAENTCGILKKPIEKRWLFVTYTHYSDVDE